MVFKTSLYLFVVTQFLPIYLLFPYLKNVAKIPLHIFFRKV